LQAGYILAAADSRQQDVECFVKELVTVLIPTTNLTAALPQGCYLESDGNAGGGARRPYSLVNGDMHPSTGKAVFHAPESTRYKAPANRTYRSICFKEPRTIVAASGQCQAYDFHTQTRTCRLFPNPIARIDDDSSCECWSA
jgi:hypothetical protein